MAKIKLKHVTESENEASKLRVMKQERGEELVHLAKFMNPSPATPANPQTAGGAVSGPSTRLILVHRPPGAGRLNPTLFQTPRRLPARCQSLSSTPTSNSRPPEAKERTRTVPTDSRNHYTPPAPRRAKIPGSSRRSPDVVFYNHPPDDDDEDNGIQPFRLSLHLNYCPDDDEERIPRPRLSLQLEDFDVTNQSIEFGRRAVSEQPVVGRASFGIRLSDQFADFRELGAAAIGDWDRDGEAGVGEMSIGSLGIGEGSFDGGRNNTPLRKERLQVDGNEETEMATGGADYDDNKPSFFLPKYSKPDLPLPEMKSQIYSSNPPIPVPRDPEIEGWEDLDDFARHARRRTVEKGDVVLLMRRGTHYRQRQLNASTTTFGLVEQHFPMELLHEIRMPVKSLKKVFSASKMQKLAGVAEEGE
ncbi:hypothetical protein RUND412_010788 [Rhizina undulata]